MKLWKGWFYVKEQLKPERTSWLPNQIVLLFKDLF